MVSLSFSVTPLHFIDEEIETCQGLVTSHITR